MGVELIHEIVGGATAHLVDRWIGFLRRRGPTLGTETRSKLHGEAAVRNIGQWARAWNQPSSVKDEGPYGLQNFFLQGNKVTNVWVFAMLFTNKHRLTPVLAAAVKRRMRALSDLPGLKERRRVRWKSAVQEFRAQP